MVATVFVIIVGICLYIWWISMEIKKQTQVQMKKHNSDIYIVLTKEEYKTWLIEQKEQVKQVFTKLYNNSERIVKASTLNPEYVKCRYIHIKSLKINKDIVSTKCCFVYDYVQDTYQIDWKLNTEGFEYSWKMSVDRKIPPQLETKGKIRVNQHELKALKQSYKEKKIST